MPSNAPLIIDSADKTPPIPARPPHVMISGADWRQPAQRRLDWPWHVSVVLGMLVLIPLALIVYWLYSLIGDWSRRNPGAADTGQWLIIALLFVLALCGVGWVIVRLYLNLAERYGHALVPYVTRTRLGNAAPTLAIVNQSLADVARFEAAAIGMQVQIAPHQKHPMLSTLSEGSHEEATTTINGLADADQPQPLLPDAGPVLEQLRKRYAKSADHLFVGTVGDTAVHLRWGAAGLTAIAGGSGGGKTNTTRLIAAWHALNGGGLALCDGHGEVDEGLIASCAALAPAFVLPPAVKDSDIARVIERMDAIGRARLAGEAATVPLLLIVDEFTSLCRNHNDAAKLINSLLNFGDEYRKVNMQALIIGHHWRGDLIDKQLGAALRSAIGARIIHTTAPEEAKFLLRPVEAQGVDRLRTGEALFFDRSADVQKIVVPWLPAEALKEVSYPAHPGWPLSVETPAQQQRTPRQVWLDDTRRTLEHEPRETRLKAARYFAGIGFGQREIAYMCRLSDESAGAVWRGNGVKV